MTDLLTTPVIDEEEQRYMAARQRSQKIGESIDKIQEKISALLAKEELSNDEAQKLQLLSQSLYFLAESNNANKLLS